MRTPSLFTTISAGMRCWGLLLLVALSFVPLSAGLFPPGSIVYSVMDADPLSPYFRKLTLLVFNPRTLEPLGEVALPSTVDDPIGFACTGVATDIFSQQIKLAADGMSAVIPCYNSSVGPGTTHATGQSLIVFFDQNLDVHHAFVLKSSLASFGVPRAAIVTDSRVSHGWGPGVLYILSSTALTRLHFDEDGDVVLPAVQHTTELVSSSVLRGLQATNGTLFTFAGTQTSLFRRFHSSPTDTVPAVNANPGIITAGSMPHIAVSILDPANYVFGPNSNYRAFGPCGIYFGGGQSSICGGSGSEWMAVAFWDAATPAVDSWGFLYDRVNAYIPRRTSNGLMGSFASGQSLYGGWGPTPLLGEQFKGAMPVPFFPSVKDYAFDAA